MSSMVVAKRKMKKRLCQRLVPGMMAAIPSPSAVRVIIALHSPTFNISTQSIMSIYLPPENG